MNIRDEQDAMDIAKKLYEQDELYILLSITNANMISGQSVPYIGALQDGQRILFVFTSYTYAKAYIDRCGYEVLDGIYTIGKIDKNDSYNSLYEICNTALHMGVQLMDINPGTEDAFGCQIPWFMQTNGLEPKEVSVMLSKEEMEHINNGGGQVPLRMNPMKIVDFQDSFQIDDSRANEILQHIFNGGDTVGEMKTTFREKESLHENCFVMDYLNTKMMPMAQNQGKSDDVAYFQQVNALLQQVVWERLGEHTLYTLVDNATGNLMVRNQSLYAIYTDRYKYMGQFGYKELSGREELEQLMERTNAQRIVVTDGPHWLAVLEKNAIIS